MAFRSSVQSLVRRNARASMIPRSRMVSQRAVAQIRQHSDLSADSAPAMEQRSAGLLKNIKFTSETYPEMKRNSSFGDLNEHHVTFFKQLLGKDAAVIDGLTKDATEDIEPFNSDWMRKYRGHTRIVLRPGSTDEVSKLLKYCNTHMLAVVPQGGNTGLVGGSVPVFDEIVINMDRMNSIRSFDDVSGVLVADAGCILEVVDKHLVERGHVFPLDLGAKGSCHIGGNIATNAGGLRLLKFGSLHGTVLGIEAVLADGTIMNGLSKLRKDNTGYDLKQLFIGSEGTIGIVTGISVLCPQLPKAVNVAYLGLSSYEMVQKSFRIAKEQLSEILSAFELMDGRSQHLVHKATGNNYPLEGRYPFYVLIETSGSNGDHDGEKLEAFLEHVLENNVVSDGVVAQDKTQANSLWSWREGVPEFSGAFGGVYKYDVSIPLPNLYSLVEDTRNRLVEAGLVGDSDDFPVAEVVGYGHMGDSNLHINVCVRRYDEKVEKELEPFIYEWIQKSRGSISAEHGLGLAKKKYIKYSRDATMISMMKQIKALYDPNGIMNPYKYI